MQRIEHEDLDTRDGLTYTWRNQPFTGVAYSLWPDGTLQDETEFVDGQMHGRYRTWHRSGQLKSEWVYDDTKPYRTERERDEAGRRTMDYRIAPGDRHYEAVQKIRAIYGRAPRPD